MKTTSMGYIGGYRKTVGSRLGDCRVRGFTSRMNARAFSKDYNHNYVICLILALYIALCTSEPSYCTACSSVVSGWNDAGGRSRSWSYTTLIPTNYAPTPWYIYPLYL